jgi:hypothetical protein
MSSQLAILNAEQYDPGLRTAPITRVTRRMATSQDFDAEAAEAPRKRPRVASAKAGNGEDDEKKRARGRPRLEAKDQESATEVSPAIFWYPNELLEYIYPCLAMAPRLKRVNERVSPPQF